MSIGATGPNDELAFYSNYGSNDIDVGAPGGGYETLKKMLCGNTDYPPPVEPGEETEASSTSFGDDPEEEECLECISPEWPYPLNPVFNAFPGGGYTWVAGTSMAAPQVAGAAALVREVAPDANARQVEQAIKTGADLVYGQSDDDLGAGRLNAADALE